MLFILEKKLKTIEDEAEFTDGDENILDKTRDAFDSLKMNTAKFQMVGYLLRDSCPDSLYGDGNRG